MYEKIKTKEFIMKVKNCRKVLVFGIIAAAIISTLALTASATDDSRGYYMILYGNYANCYNDEIQYRQTDSVDNPWKVNLAYNSEGNNTIATFWLAKENKTRVSTTHNVHQGSGDHYYRPYASANKTNVRLAVENNNNTNVSYYVSGTWDEETW